MKKCSREGIYKKKYIDILNKIIWKIVKRVQNNCENPLSQGGTYLKDWYHQVFGLG